MAPSHYLNQCWLLINAILWQSPQSNFTRSTQAIILSNEFEYYRFKIIATSPRVQWVKKKKSAGIVSLVIETYLCWLFQVSSPPPSFITLCVVSTRRVATGSLQKRATMTNWRKPSLLFEARWDFMDSTVPYMHNFCVCVMSWPDFNCINEAHSWVSTFVPFYCCWLKQFVIVDIRWSQDRLTFMIIFLLRRQELHIESVTRGPL